jgi:hypothetical protein
MDLLDHLKRQAEFSKKTFGPGLKTESILDHVKKEMKEISDSPFDLEEWIDLVLLGLDGALRIAPADVVISCIEFKQSKNEARDWPDWRTADPNRAMEHCETETKKNTGYVALPREPWRVAGDKNKS